MDYRQLPGDPSEAEDFSWSEFLDPDRSVPAEPPLEEPPVSMPVRHATGLVVAAMLVGVLAYSVPRLAAWPDSVFSKLLGLLASESMLDGEIPVDE